MRAIYLLIDYWILRYEILFAFGKHLSEFTTIPIETILDSYLNNYFYLELFILTI